MDKTDLIDKVLKNKVRETRKTILKDDDVYSGRVFLELSDDILTITDSKQLMLVRYYCPDYDAFELVVLLNDICGTLLKVRSAWEYLSATDNELQYMIKQPNMYYHDSLSQ
ncbi:MAG: hypothetical protein E6Q33_01260 [Neisseriales bacterium]|nr:MAG: hypothetical protein E6Q33_01260 [Neisseriales bacterium]